MSKTIKIFGAKASVYLKFDGDMQSLAKLLSKELILPEFYFDTDMDEPHDEFAMCETLGFELWLYSSKFKEFTFLLTIATEEVAKEILVDQMYSISPWMAKLIADRCHIDSYVYNQDTQEGFLFESVS